MLPRLAALCVACLAIPQSAFADRFYFGSADTEKNMAAGTADYLEGVLLRRENGNYVIRVQGGEITVPEASIYKIERDALTADALIDREKADAQRLLQANAQRRTLLADIQQQRADAAAARRDAARARAIAEQAEIAIAADTDYDAILDVYHSLYPPSTPVTTERTDRGMSRYIAAHEYYAETGH